MFQMRHHHIFTLIIIRSGGRYRENCELSDRGDWELTEYDFDFDNQWDYWVSSGSGGGVGGCLDGKQSATCVCLECVWKKPFV